MQEFLPCPFCGGQAEWFYSVQRVVCLVCEASAQDHVWNTRTLVAAQSRAGYMVKNLSSDKLESIGDVTPGDS